MFIGIAFWVAMQQPSITIPAGYYTLQQLSETLGRQDVRPGLKRPVLPMFMQFASTTFLGTMYETL